jgi:T5orf172 domain
MDSKDSHKNRMRWLDLIAAPLEGTPEFERLKEQVAANPEKVKKEAKRRYEIAQASVRAQMNGGAGNYPDEALRTFLMQYNYRTWNYGMRRLPMSFNVLEPFFQYEAEHIRWRLLPEVDYLFSIEDFLDFATQPATKEATVADAMTLEEGVIYNYSVYDDPTALAMQMEPDLEYVVAGTSLLRRGSELTVLIVAGEKAQSESPRVYKRDDYVDYSGVEADESNPEEPVRLQGFPEYIQAYAACRFNITSRELELRYLMLDSGRYFVVHTDDPDSLTPLSEQEIEKQLAVSDKELKRRATLFELAKTAVLLPSYVNLRIEEVKETVQPTALAAQAKKSFVARKALEKVPLDSKIFSRRILTVPSKQPSSQTPVATGRAYTAPQFEIQVKGFWRTLRDPNGIGRDEMGKPTKGKTWVKPHSRYSESPEAPKTVFIKSSRGYARRPVENYRDKTARVANGSAQAALSSEMAVSAEPSYLYVFRSPAHGLDIFKVGYTDRNPDSRARELSSTTGSPVPFLVVQAWAVVDGHAAEIAAHKALEDYRLASNREFFRGSYMILREKIEAAIATFLLKEP